MRLAITRYQFRKMFGVSAVMKRRYTHPKTKAVFIVEDFSYDKDGNFWVIMIKVD